MANPITAIASRSCAKNSLLKQTDDLSKGSSTTQVSTTSDIPIATASGSDIYGSQTDTTITSPGTEGTPGTKLPSYREAYDQDIDGVRTGGGYKDYDAYVKDMQGIKPGDTRDVERETARAEAAKGTPGTPPKEEKLDPEVTPDYEDTQGMSTFDIRKDFRRQKIAERLSGKSEKQAKRYAKRAARLEKRGKTEKAGIFDRKSEMASDRAENLRDRLTQFKTQQDQGGSGKSSYKTSKVRENLDATKERLKNNATSFTGNDPTDFQQVGKNVAKIANDVKEKGLGVAKGVGDLVSNFLGGAPKKTVLKKNYFNK